MRGIFILFFSLAILPFSNLQAQRPYLTDTISISGKSKKEQLEIITNQVEMIYDSLWDQKLFFDSTYTYDVVQEINTKWLDEHSPSDYKWFTILKTKEDQYLLAEQEYNGTINAINKLDNDIRILEEEIDNLYTKIEIDSNNLRKINITLEKELPKGLLSKLATIPQSIVLVGRIRIEGTLQRTELVASLDKGLKHHAIKQLKGSNYKIATVMLDEHIEKILLINEEGYNTQTIDSYYSDLNKIIWKESEGGPGKYAYFIQRIEVYPFLKNSPNNQENGSEYAANNKAEVDVYDIVFLSQDGSGNSMKLRNLDRGTFSSLSDHDFEDQQRKYLSFLTDHSASLNEKYKQKILKVREEYNLQNLRMQEQKESIERILDTLNTSVDNRKMDLQRAKRERERFQMEKIEVTKKEDYIDKRNRYIQFYKNRQGFTNKLVVKSGTDDSKDFKQILIEMTRKNFAAIDELTKNDTKITVYKEISDSANRIDHEETSISYKPNFEKFRILSMGITNTNFLTLNIAYIVNWNTQSPIRIQEAPDRIVDAQNQLQWKLYNPHTSYFAYAGDTEEWRLPTMDELEKLFLGAQEYLASSGNDLLMNTQLEWCTSHAKEHPFLSSEKLNDPGSTDIMRCYTVNHKYEYRETSVEGGDGVCILLVSPYRETAIAHNKEKD